MKTFKKSLLFMLSALLLLSFGCQAQPADTTKVDMDAGSPQTNSSGAPKSDDASLEPEASVAQTAAYYFPGENTLYGVASYTNTSQVPIRLTEATFVFDCETVENIGTSQTFTPIAAEQDVLMPGETGYCTLWMPGSDISSLSSYLENERSGEDEIALAFTLNATLKSEMADTVSIPLTISSPMLVQNYPTFATFSGLIENASVYDCSLNIIYAAFYDADDKLLGAWHFTRNTTLAPGDSKNFVVHLQALPIPDLAEQTARIEAHAFGMN